MFFSGLVGFSPYFPFNDPTVLYFYDARTAIYQWARRWNSGDWEILFPSYFEGVELDALLAAKVRLRFYPVHHRMKVEPAEVLQCLGPKTKALYLIHHIGFPGPVQELSVACRERGLLLIEDCAQALLSKCVESPLGSFGDVAIFSIRKTLPVPDGGALVAGTNKAYNFTRMRASPLAPAVAYAAASLRRHFELREEEDSRWILRKMVDIGKLLFPRSSAWKSVRQESIFDPAQATCGMSPLSRVILNRQNPEKIIEQRRRNYLHLDSLLSRRAKRVFEELPPGVCPWAFSLEVDEKEVFLSRLLERGVEGVNSWRANHPAIPSGVFRESEELRRTVIQLPCHQDFADAEIKYIAGQVNELLEDTRRL
jgi:perosamine synthetase